MSRFNTTIVRTMLIRSARVYWVEISSHSQGRRLWILNFPYDSWKVTCACAKVLHTLDRLCRSDNLHDLKVHSLHWTRRSEFSIGAELRIWAKHKLRVTICDHMPSTNLYRVERCMPATCQLPRPGQWVRVRNSLWLPGSETRRKCHRSPKVEL